MDWLTHYLSLTGISFMLTMGPFLMVGAVLLIVRLDILYRRRRIDDFHKKRVFITGTDTGFGRELVLKLDRKGLIVYAGCYTLEGGERLKADTSNNVRILYIDVSRRDTLERAREFIENDLPLGEGLWGVVNNAGIVRGMLFDLCTEQDFHDTMEVNFFGTVRTVEIMAPLVKRARGRFINVISSLGRISYGCEPYSSSKHALEPYTDGLRRAMKTFGVHVATIEPGYHKTNMTDIRMLNGELQRNWDRSPQSTKDEYGEDFLESSKTMNNRLLTYYPLASLNKLHHVPNAIAHALSSRRPKARYVCGLDARLQIASFNLTPDWLLDICARYLLQYHKVVKRVRN